MKENGENDEVGLQRSRSANWPTELGAGAAFRVSLLYDIEMTWNRIKDLQHQAWGCAGRRQVAKPVRK